ncbi:MAG: hypothetical protein VXY92_13665 [Planctomycetota bacterium]|nr:hypothetical protein [Planctomycetota bacterium]
MPNPTGLHLRPLAAAALAVSASISAQCPPGATMPRDLQLETTLPATGPAMTRRQTGVRALESGAPADARPHLLAALEYHPSAAALLLDLVCACADDPDLMEQWAERYVRAATDERGRMKRDSAVRKRLAAVDGAMDAIKPAQALTKKRFAAVTELARYITKQKTKGKSLASRALLVRWASELLLAVGEGAPNALGKVADGVGAHQAKYEPDYELVYAALAKVMRTPLPVADEDGSAPITGGAGDGAEINDRRIRAARILLGLSRQVRFKDLQGVRPGGPGKLGEEARQLLEAERKVDVENGKVWTIAELEDMTLDESLRFTEEHRDWHNPGIALSPNGLYRVETICGHGTLLGTAKTIELHHRRLANHYGKDPFDGRRGVARIVPEVDDLETEGAPYWWAAGFQSGDRTTVRFSWGTIPGLGRTLTHELTHRFDGVIRPFLPAWYVEGHADWTGAHYAKMADEDFVGDMLRIGTPAHTFYKGYGGKRKFERLLKGDVDDYRDNYFAGYSLYTFLKTYPPKAPRYAGALDKFERNARAGQRDPLGYFVASFCDGEDGRPEDLDGLFEDWRGFVRGCYDWLDRKREDNRWIRDYRHNPGKGDKAPLVMDEPTWSWGRNRAEPYYGQEHAAQAALLLQEVGDLGATVAAGVWSLTADGWRPEVARALSAALGASKEQEASKAFSTLANAHFPELPAADGGALLAKLPKTSGLLDALAERAAALRAAGHGKACAATAREHAALRKLFGLPPGPHASPDAPTRVPRHLGGAGFDESGLTSYEDRRRKGLWYVTPTGDLHVGREKPREATGVLDRRAQQRHAFAHTVNWIDPGHYVLRGRVHWTTSYVSGAIVFGYTRRDRNVRLGFSAGDFQYAIGKSETNGRKGRVRLSLAGLWERDGNLPDGRRSQTVEIPEEQNWFEYELVVRGPRVDVRVNGESIMNYGVHDGTPIEGYVGFATSTGALRVQQPTVQRLDDEISPPVYGLDVTKQPRVDLDSLVHLQAKGIPVGADGTLVLWLPKVDEGSPAQKLGRAIRPLSRILQHPLEYPQRWVLAWPKGMEKKARDAVLADLADLRKEPMDVVEHDVGMPFEGPYCWVIFLDSQGVMRAAAESVDPRLHSKVQTWSRKFRRRR